jgi:hypothetical protein
MFKQSKKGCNPLPEELELGTETRVKAEAGNVSEQYELGMNLLIGFGGKKDLKEAASWLNQAATQDHAKAQYEFGFCLLNGRGIEKNSQEAVKWFKKAADQNFESAKAVLNSILQNQKKLKEPATSEKVFSSLEELASSSSNPGSDLIDQVLLVIDENNRPRRKGIYIPNPGQESALDLSPSKRSTPESASIKYATSILEDHEIPISAAPLPNSVPTGDVSSSEEAISVVRPATNTNTRSS